ncbi:cytochrome bc1 complex Rieske iron-sulfur subunit [Tsukamurella soli]|uniref:Cytochrome bc1 complex Rieske iron-sulfur subunit n=1 Tax=Tsukamurella soli TaxID=644556 RepID=A0ABP8JBX9_9ACTN
MTAKPLENVPSDDELDTLGNEELVKLGTALDGVELVYREPRWPVPGTRAEKRAERSIAIWFALGGLFALAFLGVFLWWPWQYQGMGQKNYGLYIAYNPLLGITFGLSVLSIGVGAVLYTKKFIPEEIAVQQRHDAGGSPKIDKKTTAALFTNALESSTLPRRKMILASAGFGVGVLGLGAAIGFLGGLIKNPWAGRAAAPLWHTGWSTRWDSLTNTYGAPKNETVFLRNDIGDPYKVQLVKPEDMDAGGMMTVFPWRVSDGFGETEDSRERLLNGLKAIRNPVMLIRLRPEDSARAIKRKGQEDFNYGDYWAYTKVCSHFGCPTSLYEQQTNRILCPCHQSQFNALEYGKPVFGPAARALAQLPISTNEQGYMIANGDFIEQVGPAFWEATH